MVSDYDAVIVGAGHNGLVCGAYLAKQGLKICVVERRDVIGGACATEEIWPGFRAPRSPPTISPCCSPRSC